MDLRRVAAALALVVPLLALPGGAQGDPRDDKARIDAEVAKASAALEGASDRVRAAARQFAEADAALPDAELRVAVARGRVAGARVLADEAHRTALAAQGTRAAANAALATANRKVDDAQTELGHVVAAAYKGSGFLRLNVLIEARTPTDLATRMGYLKRVVGTQQAAVATLVGARLGAKLASNESLLAQREATQAEAAAEEALDTAREHQAEAEEAATAVTRLAAQRKAALDVAAATKQESQRRYEELQAESKRIEAELKAWEARPRPVPQQPGPLPEQPGPVPQQPGPVLRPGARFLMPVYGWKSSDFGMRFDPFYGVWQLHAGVDIAADGGDPIRAAADGLVVSAGWNGGYGNYTCIYHSSGPDGSIATCYAHQSAILVSEGQRVRGGQVIGRVGTTGASTGDHLHFEVRIGGEPVQPLNWLPSCLC